MSASGLAVLSTQTSLGISGGGSAPTVEVVDIRESVATYFNALTTFPTYEDMSPFTVVYIPSSNGKIVVNVSALASGDLGAPTAWFLNLKINGQTVNSGLGNFLMRTDTNDSANIHLGDMSFLYAFSVDASVSTEITLVGGQVGSNGDEGISSVSWTVLFYPS